ncbi:MAG: TusE/DsrC/DsvC family sulfur relay protein [Candidatus Zixiibacteriota bacterium]
MTEDHWRIIEFVQEYYNRRKVGPPVVHICKELGLSMRHVCDLFPCGMARGAYRLAGLPRPSGCL